MAITMSQMAANITENAESSCEQGT